MRSTNATHQNWRNALTGSQLSAQANAQTTQLFKDVAASDEQIRQAQAIIADNAQAQADKTSKDLVNVAGKLAADLNPEQRQQLASRLAPMLGPIPTLSPR